MRDIDILHEKRYIKSHTNKNYKNRVEVTRKVPMDGKLLLDEELRPYVFDRRFAVCLRIRCQKIKGIHFLGTVNECLFGEKT